MGASIENSKASYRRHLLKINDLEDNRIEPVPTSHSLRFLLLSAGGQMRGYDGTERCANGCLDELPPINLVSHLVILQYQFVGLKQRLCLAGKAARFTSVRARLSGAKLAQYRFLGHLLGLWLLISWTGDLLQPEPYSPYHAHFQIEFVFRNAKPFTGLTACQARTAIQRHNHFNASLTAVSFAKLKTPQSPPGQRSPSRW